MGRYFNLVIQQPKPQSIGRVIFDVGKDGEAIAFTGPDSDAKIVASMTRVKLYFAAADGIFLTGFERTGKTENGRALLRYQEWWLVYEQEGQ